MQTLVSIKSEIEGEELPSHLRLLEAKYGARLDKLDLNRDGKIDRTELLTFIDEVASKEKKYRYLKYGLIVSTILWVVFALTTFGAVSLLFLCIDACDNRFPFRFV